MKQRPLLIMAGCVLSASLGFLLASRHPLPFTSTNLTSRSPGTHQTSSRPISTTQTTSPSISGAKSPTNIEQIATDLGQRLASIGALQQDWLARAEVKAVLSTLSTTDLQSLALHLREGRLRIDEWSFFVLSEIAREWSARDPAEACIGLSAMAWYRSNEAFDAWAAIDPEAANKWLENSLVTEKNPKHDQLQSLFLNRLANEDLPAAIQKLKDWTPENRDKALQELSSLFALNPEKRDQFLSHIAALGDQALLEKCRSNMVVEMADKSPWAASQFVEGSDFSDEEKHALSETVLGQWALQNPQEAFGHWAELKENEAPESLLKVMQNWSINSPGAEQAVDWVNNLHPGPAREKFKENLIGTFFTFGRPQQAGELIQSLEPGATRLVWLNKLARAWSERDPGGYDTWAKSLSKEDQASLEIPVK